MIVDLPAPVLPTMPVNLPASVANDIFLSTGLPASYSNVTSLKQISPFRTPSGITAGSAGGFTVGSLSSISNILPAASVHLAQSLPIYIKKNIGSHITPK